MKVHLTTQERLKDLRTEQNLTLDELAEATGISSSTLQACESNEYQEITGSNLRTLAQFFGVTTDYLLELSEVRQPESTALSDLKIDDKTIDLLKDGHFNHQLLCEIMQHPGFERFLADIEIYIDGIAASQIHTLDSIVDYARGQVMEKYHPGEDEFTMRELKACRVDEYQYFLHTIQTDLGEIIRDLRQCHAGDKETAPEQPLLEEWQAALESYQTLKGGNVEKEFAHMCKKQGVNYAKVPELEKMFVISFIRRCKKYRPFKDGGSKQARKKK